jgi:hypothetical protein
MHGLHRCFRWVAQPPRRLIDENPEISPKLGMTPGPGCCTGVGRAPGPPQTPGARQGTTVATTR